MIFAATGHRPDKLGGYSLSVHLKLKSLALSYLSAERPKACISGMALGWDQAWACAALQLQIPLTCAVPFAGQERRWPTKTQLVYRNILQRADEVHVVSIGDYAVWKMQTRNVWMVDRCDRLIALWDGSTGGTFNCLQYAKGKCETVNLWNRYNRSTTE